MQQLCPFGGQIAHTHLENANLYVSQDSAASTGKADYMWI